MLRVDGVTPFDGAAPLTFEVAHGRCTGLLGRSLQLSHVLQAACVLVPPKSGRVTIDNLDTRTDSADARTRLTATLVDGLDRRLTLREYLSAVAGARAATGASARFTVSALIDQLGLSAHQRLDRTEARAAAALAAALLPRVSVVILIDPFAQLSPDVRTRSIELVRSLAVEPTAVLIGSAEERDVRSVSHAVIPVGAAS